MKRVTIKDVADKLNLSRNTVSKALKNSDVVAYETRYLVIETAYEMGYTKLHNNMLDTFNIEQNKKSEKTILVIARRELSTFWNSIVMGMSDELNRNNCKLQLNFISNEDEVNRVLPLGIESDISGMIILCVFNKEYLKLIIKENIPVVFLDSPINTTEVSTIGDILLFEGYNSVKEITKHLISQGIEKIGFIGDTTYCKTVYDRYIGFLDAFKELNMEPDENILITEHVESRYYTRAEVKLALEKMLYMPQAIVCVNDDVAKDVIIILKDKGLKIPQDVAVTGFDDKEENEFLEPSLTTVQLNNQKMGCRLIQQLLWRIGHMDYPYETIYMNTSVIIRNSSSKR